MRFYIDTEFIERGHEYPIELISLGIVAEDGRELYAVASDGWDEAHASDWVKANVLPQLGDAPRLSRVQIAARVLDFVAVTRGGKLEKPEFWGYYADYDWVVFCQLFGSMIGLPKGWPMFCRDIKQLAVDFGDPELPKQTVGEHNALADARHNQVMHAWLIDYRETGVDRI